MKDNYRLNTGICIINKQKLIFAGKRINSEKKDTLKSSAWQMPQGGVDSIFDENILKEGMFRELKEEVGIDRDKVQIIAKTEPLKYNFPKWVIDLNKQNQKYKNIIGQEQVWFLLEFNGNDNDIDIFQDENPEFEEWKWVTADFLVKNIIQMKKEIYIQVLKNFNLL